MRILEEGEIEIDFSKAGAAYKLDDGRPFPNGWKRVDFVVDEDRRILLIELKDPSDSMPKARSDKVRQRSRDDFRARMMGANPKEHLFRNDIVPKAIRSYLYLHMMNEDGKPCFLVLFIGMDHMPVSLEILVSLQDELHRLLKREDRKITWKRDYVDGCVIVNEKTWGDYFPHYPLSRKA